VIPLRQPLLLALLAPAVGLALATVAPKSADVRASSQATQRQQQSPDPRARIRSTVELVVVPVTVKDARGNLVDDIRKEEFRIFEDDVEQRISSFSNEAFPLSALVLLDDDLKPKAAEQLRKSLIAMAGAFSESDEVALARFGSFFTPIMDFTADNDRLATKLKSVASGDESESDPISTAPQSLTRSQPIPGSPATQQPAAPDKSTKHIEDALYTAAEVFRARSRERRKAILLITDGEDAKNNTYNYDQALEALLSADVSVYAIGTDASLLRRGANPLSRFAHATGGDVYFVRSEAALSQTYAQITEEARHQYTLAYSPMGTDRTKNYHSIEVRVERPGLNVLSRDGYYRVRLP
jgi:VWFA-related protein